MIVMRVPQLARSITIHFVTFVVYSYSELTLRTHAGLYLGFSVPRLRQRFSLITLLTYLLTLDGNGYGAIAGRGGPPRPPPRASVNLVPLLWTAFDTIRPGGPTRTSADFPCPGLQGFPGSP